MSALIMAVNFHNQQASQVVLYTWEEEDPVFNQPNK